MTDKYYVISGGEDGRHIMEYTKEALEKRLNDQEYYGNYKILKQIPINQGNWEYNEILIIKGEIIIPNPIKIVTKYEI